MVDDDDPKAAPAGNEPAGNEKADTASCRAAAKANSPKASKQRQRPKPRRSWTSVMLLMSKRKTTKTKATHPPQGEKNRLQRYREQTARLKAENEALRSRDSGGPPSDQAQLQRALEYAVLQKIGDPPQQKDFGDDYVAFANAKLAYEIDARQVSREVRRDFATTIKTEQDRVAGQVAEHKERVQRLRSRVKDFDEVMARATLPVMPHVERLLLASKKSDRLTYVLGKNQAKLAQLNRSSPEEAAREIGRLEGRLSLPPATKAKRHRLASRSHH